MSERLKLTAAGIALFFAFAIGLLFLYAARDVLVVLLVALTLAAALRLPVLALERWLPRVAAALEALPVLGPILAAIPAIFVATLQDVCREAFLPSRAPAIVRVAASGAHVASAGTS